MKNLPGLILDHNKYNNLFHSEVLGMLGPRWENNTPKVLKIIQNLLTQRPNKNCYIASQQLGGKSCFSEIESSFIHRDSIWKPWINGSWPAGNKEERNRCLSWMKNCWSELEFICPGIHLAQMHNHLTWHEKELTLAFKDWLPKLKKLKLRYDPDNILPPL